MTGTPPRVSLACVMRQTGIKTRKSSLRCIVNQGFLVLIYSLTNYCSPPTAGCVDRVRKQNNGHVQLATYQLVSFPCAFPYPVRRVSPGSWNVRGISIDLAMRILLTVRCYSRDRCVLFQ